jgi:hypothetical protein
MVGLLRLAAILIASWAMVSAAAAQTDPRICAGLEAQLDRMNRGAASPDAQRYQQALAQQRAQIDRALTMSDRMHCSGGGFLFGPSPAPQCPQLQNRIAQMQQNAHALEAQLRQRQGGDPRLAAARRSVLAALSQNGCGSQYAGYQERQQRPRGLFDLLFGNRGDDEAPPAPNGPITLPEQNAPRSSTYRTVCVRKADGFFYPISFATTRNNFERDAQICRRTCPGTPAALYAYPNPGGSMKDAVSIDGQPYKDLPNAFLYKKKFVAGVSCKPSGETWAQALANTNKNVNLNAAGNEGGSGSGNGILAESGRPQRAVNPVPTQAPGDDRGAPADYGQRPSYRSGVTIDGREPPTTVTTEPLDPLH